MSSTQTRPAAGKPTKVAKHKYGSAVADDLINGMQALLDDMQSGKGITVREVGIDLTVPELTADDIRAIRESLGLSQTLFAEFLGASASSVRAWERGAKNPTAMGRRFLDAIRTDPEYWRAKLALAITSKKKVIVFGAGERRK